MEIHSKVAKEIAGILIDHIRQTDRRYCISVSGESGCGKTRTGKALVVELASKKIRALLLGQDDYFVLPPSANDARRKMDPTWLGPHKEVRLDLMQQHLLEAQDGASTLEIPHIEYSTDKESLSRIDIQDVKVIIVEGTYTSLLRSLDARIFIDEDYKETLKFRKLRNRGNEVNDPFVERILETEHKIIAGHKFLADIIITSSYEVIDVRSG